MKPETIAIHAGGEPDPATGAVAPSIQLSTTFRHGPAGERAAGYEYVRETNPVQDRLETALAAIEGGAAALAFASGMAAQYAWLMALPAGAHLLVPRDVYQGLRTLAQEFLVDKGISASAVDTADVDAVRAAITPATRALWLETPSNPLLVVSDIAALAEIARARGVLLAVDNTFATPALQQPLALGADVVMHSTTKYLGGHSDVMGGALVFRERDEAHGRIFHARHIQGAVMAPFNAWLTLRGIRSLHARMAWHCRNARALAEYLDGHPAVAQLNWPGLPKHRNHAVAALQMRDYGGMASVRIQGGREAALRVASRLRVFTNATSLGGVESLVEHRASVEGANPVSPQDLLRLSIGLEHPDDLIEDWRQALG